MADQIQKKISSELKENLLYLYKKVGVPADIRLKKSCNYFYKNDTYSETRTYTSTRKLQPSEEGTKIKFEDAIQIQVEQLMGEGRIEVADQLEKFTFGIEYNLGDKFISLTGLERLIFQGDKVEVVDQDYNHEDGQVTLVDFWATWWGPCQNPMQHNEEMLKTNSEKWAGKVKIVAISFDNEQEGLVKSINEKDWKHIDHYRMKKGWDDQNKVLQFLHIEVIPFITLLDKFGRVSYMGHPRECKIEEEINKLVLMTEEVHQLPNLEEKTEKMLKFEKEQFQKSKKFLRNTWKNYLYIYWTIPLVQSGSNLDEYFNLTLSKESINDTLGKKTGQSREKLQIQYKVNIHQKKQASRGVNLIDSKLGSESYLIMKEMICDPQQEFKNHTHFFRGLATKYSLPLELVVSQRSFISIRQSEEIKLQEETRILQDKNLLVNQIQTHSKTALDMRVYFKMNQETNIEQFRSLLKKGLNFSLSVGDLFSIIGDVYAPNKFGETINISHVEGQVLIAYFFSHAHKNCIKGLNEFTDLFLANKKKWDGNVRMIGLNPENEESCKQSIMANPQWSGVIDFFYFQYGSENDTIATYQVKQVPYYVIVGKDGRIRSLGDCQNIEITINDLLSEDVGQNQLKSVDSAQVLTNDQYKNFLDFVKDKDNFTQLHKNANGLIKNTFKFELSLTSVFQLDLETADQVFKFGNKPTVSYWIRENNKHLLDDILKKIYSIIPKDQMIVEETISKTFDIPFPGLNCALCLTLLDDQTPQYYSPFTKVFYCTECTESEDETKKGLERYRVNDTVIFINAPLHDKFGLLNIDEFLIGKNFKPQNSEGDYQANEISCNGCGLYSEATRYIAISCRPGFRQDRGYVDMCQNCFKTLKEKTSKDARKIMLKNKKDHLTTDSLLLRVLFSQGYDNY